MELDVHGLQPCQRPICHGTIEALPTRPIRRAQAGRARDALARNARGRERMATVPDMPQGHCDDISAE